MKRYIFLYKEYQQIKSLFNYDLHIKIYAKVETGIAHLTQDEAKKIIDSGFYLYEDTQNRLCYAPPIVAGNGNPAPIHASNVLDITRLHGIGLNGKYVKIGIIDTGCNDNHVSTMPSIIRVDFTGLGISHDAYNHGSRLCYMNGYTNGYTASTTPGPQDLKGTCYAAQIYSLKAFEAGSAGVIAALNYAVTNGIHLVGIALDVGGGCDAAVTAAINAGVIVVASSGNVTNGVLAHPANVPGIIVVNAIGYNNPTVHLGSHITSNGSVGVTNVMYNFGHLGNIGGTSQSGSGNTLPMLGLYKAQGVLGPLDITVQVGNLKNQDRARNLLYNKCLPIDGYNYNVATNLKSGKMLNYETGAGFPDKLIKT